MAHILIVDDIPDMREFAVLALRKAGHHVVDASSGQEAVDRFIESMADRARFDLVILDVAMPGMDGLQAAEKIRQQWPHQKIAFLTAFDDPITYSRAKVGGSCAFWSKPITAPDLLCHVAAVL